MEDHDDYMLYTDIPFKVLQEEWNTYLLEDGSVIRARAVLLKVRMWPADRESMLRVSLDVQRIFVVSAPSELRGRPTEPPTEEEVISSARHGLAVRVVKGDERYNVYKILPRGVVFKTKLIASDMAFRLPRYDLDGQPVYVLGTTLAVMAPPRVGMGPSFMSGF